MNMLVVQCVLKPPSQKKLSKEPHYQLDKLSNVMSLFRSNDGHFIFFWLLKYRAVSYMISVAPGKLEASDSWSLESALLTSGGNTYSLNTVKL